MGKAKLLSLFLVVCLVLGCQGPSADRVTLKVKYPPGAYLATMKMDSTTAVAMADMGAEPRTVTMSMLMDMHMDYGRPDGQGRQDVTITYTRVRQAMQMGDREIVFDSNDPADKQSPQMAQMLGPMVGARIVVVVDAAGKVVSIQGLDELFNKIASGNPAMAPMMNDLKKNFGEQNIREMCELGSRYLPAKPVAVGEEFEQTADLRLPMFGTMQMTYHGKVASIAKTPAGRIATIQFTGRATVPGPAASPPASQADSQPSMMPQMSNIKLTLDQTGTQTFNVDKGLLVEATINQTGDIQSSVNMAGTQKDITTTLKQTITMTVSPL
jgi:hypothetical protein